jgi:hypothetical protein
MIAGGAAFALASSFAGLDGHEIRSCEVAWRAGIARLSAGGGALIGACHSFLVSSHYRWAAAWLPAGPFGATLSWAGSARVIVAPQPGAPQHPLLEDLPIAAAMAVSSGELAAGTALATRKLKLQPTR